MKPLASLLIAAALAAAAATSIAQAPAASKPAASTASAAAPAAASAPAAGGASAAPAAASAPASGAAPAAAAASAPADGHAAAPAAPAKPAKPDLVKGEASFAVCVACHSADGNSTTPAYPKLAGQHPEYLVKQLKEFKSGKRNNAIMAGFAAALSDDDMRNIAYFLTAKKAKPGYAKDKELVAAGERIYRGGIPDKQVPACAGCHTPSGAGIPSQYPRLGGQHADYTTAQLIGFRDGGRKNGPMMATISSKLNDREIRAVSDYIAGLR